MDKLTSTPADSNNEKPALVRVSGAPSLRDMEEGFSTLHEAAALRAHDLALLAKKQGLVGSIIGSDDSSLNLAFVMLIIGALAILGVIISEIIHPGSFPDQLQNLVSFELTIIGYVMGKKTS